jgi:hypothetical protein
VEDSLLVLLLLCIHLRHRGTRPGASSRRQGRRRARGSGSPCSSRPRGHGDELLPSSTCSNSPRSSAVHPLEDGLHNRRAPGRRSAELLACWDARHPGVVAGGGGPGRAEGPPRPRAHAAARHGWPRHAVVRLLPSPPAREPEPTVLSPLLCVPARSTTASPLPCSGHALPPRLASPPPYRSSVRRRDGE